MPTPDDDSASDREDELPQVVVLKSGDLTADEVKQIKDEEIPVTGTKKGGWGRDLTLGRRFWSFFRIHFVCYTLFSCTGREPPADGKILFKKPEKRSSSEKFQGITASSSKKKKNDGENKEEEKEKSGKKIKNNSLLSFGGDEEEDED